MRYYLLLTLILLCTQPAIAQQEQPPAKAKAEMDVELPDETEEAALLKPGELQLETAYLYNKFKEERDAHIGLAMLRYGVSKRLELRLLAEDGRQRDVYMEQTVQSTYPLAASAKVSLLKDHKHLPDITLISYLKLPFTSRAQYQNSYWSPIFLMAFEHQFGDKWKLEYNVGVQQEAYSRHWVWLGNASLHYKIAEPVEIFTEYFAQYDNEAAPQHNAGIGVSYQAAGWLEFFAAAGTTIDYPDPNHFFTAGLAVKRQ